MAYQLLTKYASDAAVKAVVDKFDFYITPVVNPDGKPHSPLSTSSHLLTNFYRFRLHPVHQPSLAQEPSNCFRKLLRWPRHQPQLAL